MVRDCQATAAAWFHTSSCGVIYGRDIKTRNDPVESGSVNLADVWARHQGKKWPHVIRLHQARRRRRGRVHVHAPIRLCSVADLWGPLVQQISEVGEQASPHVVPHSTWFWPSPSYVYYEVFLTHALAGEAFDLDRIKILIRRSRVYISPIYNWRTLI